MEVLDLLGSMLEVARGLPGVVLDTVASPAYQILQDPTKPSAIPDLFYLVFLFSVNELRRGRSDRASTRNGVRNEGRELDHRKDRMETG
ncbi:hypothetical protein CCMSSC00406_0006499 [Pleurotus cornucopiae]|uniref:Uncharacterized protein n=1 Tax=Pleurotus cornucopiae TaxID=5321 RepID=A0ACB7J7V0_PLECO|nr:hypothetical protein CCMSSC00406_0006499 [Pleurotus cornucopiae]